MPAATRTSLVISNILRKIDSRSLEAGEKLPSIRACAGQLKVSPSTVADAYDRLVADGVIFARAGAGFYVATAARPFVVTNVGPKRDQDVDPFWVSKQSLDANDATLKPGCGWLPADWMPLDAMRRALRKTARTDGPLLSDYGITKGAENLRKLIARRCDLDGLSITSDQILLTSSGTQTIDLICRMLLRAGDTVVIDDPCYFNFQALLRAHRVHIVSVPFTQNGPDMDAFEQLASGHKPKLYITNSALHNPTGATISAQTAHRIVALAKAHDFTIVEDDIFSELEASPSPRLAALDGLERVLRIGSFSKTVSASVRCGYVVASADRIDALIDLQVATNFGGPSPLAVELIHSVLTDGSYRKHMEALRARLARQRRDVIEKLAPLGIKPWHLPRDGFYLWCTLPEGCDAARVAQLALTEDVVFAPGNVFSLPQTMTRFMRFNVSQMQDEKTYTVLHRALTQSQL